MADQRSVAFISGMICSAESKVARDMGRIPDWERKLILSAWDDKRDLATSPSPVRAAKTPKSRGFETPRAIGAGDGSQPTVDRQVPQLKRSGGSASPKDDVGFGSPEAHFFSNLLGDRDSTWDSGFDALRSTSWDCPAAAGPCTCFTCARSRTNLPLPITMNTLTISRRTNLPLPARRCRRANPPCCRREGRARHVGDPGQGFHNLSDRHHAPAPA